MSDEKNTVPKMGILKTIFELKDALSEFVFPPHCLLCDSFLSSEEDKPDRFRPEALVCSDCWESLNILPHPFCPSCRAFLEPDRRRCPVCPESSFNLNRSLGAFDPEYQTLIHHFKYKRKFSIGKSLGKRLGAILKKDECLEDIDYIVPVPLHPSRERERGYNQSKILAQEVSELTSVPALEKVLLRKKKTKDQTHLSPEERQKNVSGAFAVKDDRLLKGKKVLLVDDVITTGATLKECSKVLKQMGVKEVIGATVVVVIA